MGINSLNRNNGKKKTDPLEESPIRYLGEQIPEKDSDDEVELLIGNLEISKFSNSKSYVKGNVKGLA
jgi:hypothetical protein